MNKNKIPQAVKLEKKELDELKKRIDDGRITADDLVLFKKLIEFNLWLQNALGQAKLGIRRLKSMFGFKSEKRKNKQGDNSNDTGDDKNKEDKSQNNPQDNAKSNTTVNFVPQRTPKPPKKPEWNTNANHGCYGFDDYSGCETIRCDHKFLKAGMICPKCENNGDNGKLYVPDSAFATYIVLEGNSIITGKRYQAEQFRCSFCGTYYTADVPESVKCRASRYDESCATALAIHRYYFGFPFKRIEKAQSIQNIPVPDATQWDKVLQAWNKVKPVYQALFLLAAQGQPCFDDTTNKITLSIPLPNGRKGIYTTAIVSKLAEHDIFLFKTSHQYAGENITDVFSARKSAEPIISMSDASANNTPKGLSEVLLARWIFCFCLAHGRRKFYDLLGSFDKESQFVLDIIGIVYDNDRHCRNQNLNDIQRLHYHQVNSAPLMQSLWAWLNNQLSSAEVEENSEFADAVEYLLKYWQQLTQFLRVPGALLDNNICERAIKVVIRHRRNSLFFRTFLGAEVGDGFMSIIHTAVESGIDPFDYLTTLQVHQREVEAAPEQWLPWCYKATLNKILIDQAA